VKYPVGEIIGKIMVKKVNVNTIRMPSAKRIRSGPRRYNVQSDNEKRKEDNEQCLVKMVGLNMIAREIMGMRDL